MRLLHKDELVELVTSHIDWNFISCQYHVPLDKGYQSLVSIIQDCVFKHLFYITIVQDKTHVVYQRIAVVCNLDPELVLEQVLLVISRCVIGSNCKGLKVLKHKRFGELLCEY